VNDERDCIVATKLPILPRRAGSVKCTAIQNLLLWSLSEN